MTKIGYARVSTTDQATDIQDDRLLSARANPPGLGQSERAAWTDAGWMGGRRSQS
jgi:hypothetical protein